MISMTAINLSEEQFLRKLGFRIYQLRNQRKITQEKLAEMIDVHRTMIVKIESGQNAHTYYYYLIAKSLGVHVAELFNI